MTFLWTPLTLALSAIVMIAAAVVCWISWNRAGRTRTMGLLELSRFGLILLAVLTLNQPEWTQTIVPDEQPTLVVLHDVSDSMNTEDVVNPQVPEAAPRARKAIAEPLLDPELWAPVSDRMQVVIQPFSSSLPDPVRGTDLAEALRAAVAAHPNLRGIVLLTDGDWNTGDAPAAAASALRVAGVPVNPVALGSEERLPDLVLAASDAPTYGVVGKTMSIPFRVDSWLPEDRDVTLTLAGTGEADITKTVRLPGMGQVQDTLPWLPEKIGDYTLTLEMPVVPTETLATNNKLTIPITIRNEALRVLLVESYPRWEYRYLRNALERDPGVDVNSILFHPDIKEVGGGRGYLEQFPSSKLLFDYDVVFLGDVGVGPGQLSTQDCENLSQLVRSQAGGLVFLPGFRGYQNSLRTTELEELNPVIYDPGYPKGHGSSRPARIALTEAGRRSLLTRLEQDDDQNEMIWRNLPGFSWYAGVQRAKIGTQVLAAHETDTTQFGRIPLIATRTVGTGKVLFMGTDGAWRWRRGVEDLYHYRFWGQVVRWMAYQRNMSQGESMRLFYSPDRPEAGNVLTLNANVMSAEGEPLRTGNVTIAVTSPSGRSHTIRLAAAGSDTWGLFTGTFTPTEGGSYKLVTTSAETGKQLETIISVQGREKEQIGQPARYDVLREIAQITRGELTSADNVRSLVDRIAQLPEPDPVVRRFRIWSHAAWGGLIVLALGAFWVARKLAGLA